MTLPPVRHQLDERDAAATAGAVHRLAGDPIHLEHVVAVGSNTRYAVADALVGEGCCGALPVCRGRVGVAVVLHDHHERTPLDSGEVEPLVERARGGSAVADVQQADAGLAAEPERQRHTRHDGDHIAEMGDLADEPAVEVADVDVELPAAGEAVAPCHVLPQDLHRPGALYQHRAEVPDERGEHVAGLESVGGAYSVRFLPERTEQPADDLGLPIQGHQTLFEHAGEPHEPIQLEQLITREAVQERGSGWSEGGHANPEGVAGKLTGPREWANEERG